MKAKKRLAVLISGRGSNLQSIIDACKAPDFPAEIAIVVSNIPDVFGLERARLAHIPALTLPHGNYPDRKTFEEALLAALLPYQIDLICLAGFMRLLTPHFLEHWAGCIINIHPSLLPLHKGLDTHAKAIAAGDTEAGCTVHHVTAEMDSGDIIVQRRVPIIPGDTEDTLAARVLEQEHIAYPAAIRKLLCGAS
jgi:phosphoribosylglycinamide formyltransferase-1